MHEGFEPIAHRNGYPSGKRHDGMREHCTGDAIRKTWEKCDTAYRDEHKRDIRHDLGMPRNEVPQGLVQPGRHSGRGICHHWEIGLLINELQSE